MVRSSMRSSAFRAEGFRASRPEQQSSTACRKRAEHIRGDPSPSTPRKNSRNLAPRAQYHGRRIDGRSRRASMPQRRVRDRVLGRIRESRPRAAVGKGSSSSESIAAILRATVPPAPTPTGSRAARRRPPPTASSESPRRARRRSSASRARRRPPLKEQILAHQVDRAGVDVQRFAAVVEQARRPGRAIRARRPRRARARPRATAPAAFPLPWQARRNPQRSMIVEHGVIRWSSFRSSPPRRRSACSFTLC